MPDAARAATVLLLAVIAVCVASCAHPEPPVATNATHETVRVQLPTGATDVDVYWPESVARTPMVIIAHGFSRGRHNMSGWGRHLAQEGFVAVVPDLPSRADHARNGRFISELRDHLSAGEPWSRRIDPARVGRLGFSAGGLASLLAAADSPGMAAWVGLDPVDRDRMGAKAAARVQAATVVLTAEPSSCNVHDNARGIIAALPRPEHFTIPGAVHVDAEWPPVRAPRSCPRAAVRSKLDYERLVAAGKHKKVALIACTFEFEDGDAYVLDYEDYH